MRIINYNRALIGKNISFILLLVLFTAIRANATPQKIRFDRISVLDGLSDNTITSVCQDSKGFMWFGTTNGLNRFDGYNYIHFKHDPNDSTTIADNYVQVVFEDQDNVLWAGTLNGGLNRYDSNSRTFVQYTHNPDNPKGISSNTVFSVTDGKDGSLWVGTVNGLNLLDRDTGNFTLYLHDPSDSLSLNNNNIGSLFTDSKGNVWIGTNYGLNKITYGSDVIQRMTDNNKITSELIQNIVDIVEGNDGVLWLSTWGGGLRKFDTETETYEVFLHNPDDPNSIRSNIVGHISFDNKGLLWVGTPQGLHYFDPATGIFTHTSHDPADPFSISNDAIWAVYHDRSGIAWIGTLYGGGNKIVPSKSIFRIYNFDEIDKGVSKGGFVDKFFEMDSSLWFASNYGLHSFDTEKETFTSHVFSDIEAEGIEISQLRTVFNDDNGHLWLGTSISGLVRFDLDTGLFHPIASNDLTSSVVALDVSEISKDQDGIFWIGTNVGILTFDPKTESYKKSGIVDSENSKLIGATNIEFDSDGERVWISGLFGLSQLDRKSKKLRFIFSNKQGSRSLRSNLIYSFLDDGLGSLWLGTNDGLFSYNKETEDLTRYSLPNDYVYGLIKDKRGDIWANTITGLSRIQAESKKIQNYTVGDGLPSAQNMNLSMCCVNDGTIFIGGQNGFLSFHPDSILTGNSRPPVVITSLKVDNVEAEPGKNITELTEIVLPYRNVPLSFEFAALDYANPANNEYEYKMEGLNENWIQSGHERKVTYTNVAPGSYVFRVKAANNQGVWNHEGVSLQITIIPPFWKTVWFRLLVIISFFGLVYLVYLQRVRTVLARNKELERRVEKRTEELRNINKELLNEIDERKKAESQVNTLSGLLPICASCKKIRNDEGYWTQIESFIKDHSDADFSHGICPDCIEKLYPEYILLKNKKINPE